MRSNIAKSFLRSGVVSGGRGSRCAMVVCFWYKNGFIKH
jgi:hypothetical protein